LSDPEQFDPGVVAIEAPEGCSFTNRLDLGAAIFEAQCGYGNYSFTLPALSIVDLAGNQGPVSDVAISFEHLAPPEPEMDEVIENGQPIATEPLTSAPIELPDLAEVIPTPVAIEPSPSPAETIAETEPTDLTENQTFVPALPLQEPNLSEAESPAVIEPTSAASPIQEVEDTGEEEVTRPQTETSSLEAEPSDLAQTVSLEVNKSPQITRDSFGWVWIFGLGLGLVLILFVAYRFIGK
jgi:hypothetical protein